jgi:hypothetical protein
MTQDQNQLISLMNTNHKTLRTEVREGFKEVNEKLDKMVSKEQCEAIRKNCNNKTEWSIKKITAVSSAAVAIIGAATTLVLTIAKIFGVV